MWIPVNALARLHGPSPHERVTGPLLQERDTWIVVALVWGMTGVVTWLLEYMLFLGDPRGAMTLGRAAARLVSAVIWWGVTLFAIWISDTVTLHHPRQYLIMLFHAVIGALVALGWPIAAYYANLAIIPGWQPRGVGQMVHTTYLTTYFFYIGIVSLAHGIIFAREHRARELEARSRELEAVHAASLSMQARLQALKMELQPHFLFNTLNAVSALMHRDVTAANEMLVLLADMLHAALANVHHQEVTLKAEIETLKLYVQIQQIRFGDRLQVVWRVDPDTLRARVPHLILQPMVENAIVHGIAERARGGRIEILACRTADQLELVVRDDGQGLGTTQPGFGLGISNTRARLAQLYGDEYRFELANLPEGGTVASVSLPFVEVGADESRDRSRGDLPPVEETSHEASHPGSDRR